MKPHFRRHRGLWHVHEGSRMGATGTTVLEAWICWSFWTGRISG